ncbi:MAG TPA: 16S rRNA (guanine(966)-N(2))-methyltransferase RsmD [Vicinamibacterales bacterium]|nr:16S rRNA (guanine(966)-N(2))-methyltransferase RsmD [Vicinamibacterales bacterium]
MRIIAGALRGRRLKTPAWEGLRPTSDRLRETLFNIIAARVPAAHVLDGFAGTGAIGIEALSRGAERVVFVERDPRAARLIAENLARCGVENGYVIIRADLSRIATPGDARPFDLIVLDPPYDDEGVDAVVARAGAWLDAAGLLVLEHARRRPAPLVAGTLTRTRTVQSGDSALSFYQPTAATLPVAGDTTPSTR